MRWVHDTVAKRFEITVSVPRSGSGVHLELPTDSLARVTWAAANDSAPNGVAVGGMALSDADVRSVRVLEGAAGVVVVELAPGAHVLAVAL